MSGRRLFRAWGQRDAARGRRRPSMRAMETNLPLWAIYAYLLGYHSTLRSK